MKKLFYIVVLGTTAVFTLNCQKNYFVDPLPLPVATPASPLPPNTPTITPSPNPAATSTPTATPQPTLPAPQVIGWPDEPQGYMQVVWPTSTSPNVTGYSVYRGASSSAMTLWGTLANSGTWLSATDTSTTTYNEYVCVVATGTLPSSPQSDIVHAVSGTTAANSLTLSASSSTTPDFSITSGTVSGTAQRVWVVVVPGGATIDWVWDDTTGSINPVAYGYSGSGLTYALPTPLSAATSYNVIVASINSQNWCIDYSGLNFTTP